MQAYIFRNYSVLIALIIGFSSQGFGVDPSNSIGQFTKDKYCFTGKPLAHKVFPLTQADVARRSNNGEPNERYDLIIVGAGTSGSIFLNNLAKSFPNLRILMLEVGKDDTQDDTPNDQRTPQEGPNPNDFSGGPLGADDWGQLIRGVSNNSDALNESCAFWQDESRSPSDVALFRQVTNAMKGATFGGTAASNSSVWIRRTAKGTYHR